MITTKLESGDGSGNIAKVDSEGALQVVVHPHPPINETLSPLPFSQFFTTTGISTGSTDMIVNGATTAVPFYIRANDDFDIYINSISIQISDPGAALDRFGALTALTNGVKFYYFSAETGEYILADAIKTNLDFFRDATGGKDFGDGTGAWKADISGGTGQDTYFPEIDLSERFGLQWGLRIAKGSSTKLVYEVRDNLAGLAVFNIKAYGIRI